MTIFVTRRDYDRPVKGAVTAGLVFTLAAAGFSRGVARFQRPKRLTLFALLAEGLTLVAVVSGFAFSVLGHHR